MKDLIITNKHPLLFSILVCIILAGCNTIQPTPFAEADNYGDMGYSEKKLTEDQYQVIFTGNAKTDLSKAKDFALLHSALLTLEKGFKWFEIIQRDSDIKTKTVSRVAPQSARLTQVQSTCGVLGCTITTASNYEGGEVRFEQVADKVVSTLMIKMGKENPENSNRVFDAQQLVNNLKNKDE